MLADDFADYFSDKISNIRASFPEINLQPHSEDKLDAPQFDTLLPTSEDELRKLIMSCKTKSCSFKDCLDCLLPVIVRIVNLSFSSSTFPDSLKLALVIPLLKKILLDIENKKNYRPVSNLPFLGKVIEKTAINRFSGHVKHHNLDEIRQSAYKEYHSVETALLVVFDDLLSAIDNRKHVLVCLLDYSAAFDTIDHSILFRRLLNSYGFSGDALEWVKSYFTDRHQAVTINGVLSKEQQLPYGMPQGSLMGPFKYPKYSGPIASIAQKHQVKYHQYADDTQLYVICDVDNAATCKTQLEQCIEEIRTWSTSNKLKLNDSKTEFLVVGSKFARKSPDITSVNIGNTTVNAVESARNIGVIMDSTLSMVLHVSAVCKSAYSQLRNIAQIRRHLTQDATATLIHSLVTSRLDNMNSLLHGLPNTQLHKLQRIQNHAAKVVVRKKKCDHATPILKSLHWLKIPYRIEYKLLLIVFKCLHGQAPKYLSERLEKYVPGRVLCSGDSDKLVERKANLKTYGDRCFSVAVPKLWNALPKDLRALDNINEFKSSLKTHLFKQCFRE